MFKKNVCMHIPHPYSQEMSEKSEVVGEVGLFYSSNIVQEI